MLHLNVILFPYFSAYSHFQEMDIVIPENYWNAFSQFAKRVGIQPPTLPETVGSTKLSKKDVAALRKALTSEHSCPGTTEDMRRLVKELLDLASPNLSNVRVKCAVTCLKELIEMCASDIVVMDFNSIGAAKLLVPFVCHREDEVKTSALELASTILQNRQHCQNSFASAHFAPILMHIVSDATCDLAQQKALHALFCLCFGNEYVSRLFCELGGISKLLHLTQYPKLAIASCIMLSKILNAVPKYKKSAWEQGALDVLLGLASDTHDGVLREKAVDTMLSIVDDYIVSALSAYGNENLLLKLNLLSGFITLQESARLLLRPLYVMVKQQTLSVTEELILLLAVI
ncbi:hypothetical protein M514_04048 [Trichuris suis]|uniref:Armadillo/beta-catenin-like repeat protein n=1 Tax=Trichuris suis TaxID=68888 RepID=A0A085NSS2_9BILA|nr:hypothetical protein M514_04048 [Trichuris suis]